MIRFVRAARLVFAVALTLLASACQHGEQSVAPVAPAAPVKLDLGPANDAIATPAWLRDRLPADTIGYLRLPSLLGLLAAPDGRMLDPLLVNAAHLKIIAQVQDAIAHDALIAKSGFQPLIKFAFDDLASPLEIALIGSGKVASPASQVLLTARLRYADAAALNAALTASAQGAFVLSKPVDASGAGELTVGGTAIPLRFDATTQRAFMLGGMGASAAQLQGYIQETATVHAGALQPLEARLDQGGQGLLVWLNVEAFRSIAALALAQPDQAPMLKLLQQVRGIAFGWGTVDGRGHAGFTIDAPNAKALRYLAHSPQQSALQTAGPPRWAMTMALPTPDEWREMQAAVGEDFGADKAQGLQQLMTQMKTAAGFDFADLLDALGPELDAVEDDAGSYAALRVRDPAKFQALLAQLVKTTGAVHATREIAGTTYHSLQLPAMSGSLASGAAAAGDGVAGLIGLAQRVVTHIYWIERDGTLLLAKIPQPLQDYVAATTHSPLQPWLVQRQGIDASQATLAATVRTHDNERSVYAAYVGTLQLLADLAGAKIDLFDLPTPNQLQLPRDAAFGVQLRATRDSLGADLVYEQTPLEMVSSGGGMAAIAGIGIVAAIAIPAYSDYTTRAHVAIALDAVAASKVEVEEYYAQHHKLPESIKDLSIDTDDFAAANIESVDFEHHTLVIAFDGGNDTRLSGFALALAPLRGPNGTLVWQCGTSAAPARAESLGGDARGKTTLTAKYLPASCR